MHRLQEMVRLHRMGTGVREVARLLKMGPNTERQYRTALSAEGLLEGDPAKLPELATLKAAVLKHKPVKSPPQQDSTATPWLDEITKMVKKGARPRPIYDYLRLNHKEEFKASYWAVKRLCRRLKKAQGVKPEDVVIPVEVEPAERAQVDFGYVGRLYDPETELMRKAWVFVVVLCHSRHMFARIVFNQKVETWLHLHVLAFEHFGGVVRVMVPDNLKSAVVRAAFAADGPAALNRSYRELARHYDIKIDPAPPHSPEKKGRVESGVKYVKNNFFKPRDLHDIMAAQAELKEWVIQIAGQREHGTTGRKPLEMFESEEREVLQALPAKPFEFVVWKEAKVHRDSHFQFERRFYSVPFKLIGKQVWARATPHTVEAYADDERVATHERRGRKPFSTRDEHLPEYRVEYRYQNRACWEKRADRMGLDVGVYIREVFDSDKEVCKLRIVQGIVTFLAEYPPERAQAACRRASYFGNYTSAGLKNILRKALDLEPLPDDADVAGHRLLSPRFARKPEELFPH